MENFIYSQNSLNIYKSCPKKFKNKYVDNFSWKKEDKENYYDGLIEGSEFHLICERYFLDVELGINIDYKFYEDIQNVINLNLKEDAEDILPEYELNYTINSKKISTKFDLLLVKNNKFEIYDWKTQIIENKKISTKSSYEKRMQTAVYLLVAYEVLSKVFNKDIKFENISMNYFEVSKNNLVTINYSENMYFEHKKLIKRLISQIENDEFNITNKKHCDYCEFDGIC
ncbi:MAG: PD-(D/E)XK nuclease family protein [Peptostreptococcaceae bacterium]